MIVASLLLCVVYNSGAIYRYTGDQISINHQH